MDITKYKDNEITKNDEYIDAEILADNFDGNDKQLKFIAKNVYDMVDMVSYPDDEEFMDKCDSMIGCDYDFVNPDQHHQITQLIDELIINNGKFKGE